MRQQSNGTSAYVSVDNATGTTITIPTSASEIAITAYGCRIYWRTGDITLLGTDVDVDAAGGDNAVPNGVTMTEIVPGISDAEIALRAPSGSSGTALVQFFLQRSGSR